MASRVTPQAAGEATPSDTSTEVDDAGAGDARASTSVRSWRSVAQGAALVVLFLALSLVMLRPPPDRLDDSLPENLGDPALVTWILRYGSHALTDDPFDVFDAPMFWPHDDTLAYSESMLPVAPIYGAIHFVVGDDIVAMNLVIVGFFVFNLVATYALAAYLLRNRLAAFVSALAFSFSGYVMVRAGHPHLQPVGVFALGYLANIRMLDAPRIRNGVLAGIANAVAFLTCLYYGAIWAVCLAVLIGGWLVLRRFRVPRATLMALGAMAAVSAVLILPVARVYADQDVDRGLDPALGLNVSDLFIPATGTYVHSWLEDRTTVDARIEHTYFPGALPIVFGAVGAGALAVRWSRTRRQDAPAVPVAGVRGEPLALVCVGGAVALVLALGPVIGSYTAPFQVFRDHVPGFAGIRVPSRLAVPALLAGALVAGVGVAAVVERLGRRTALVATAVLSALVLVELAAPVRRVDVDRSDAVMAVYEELATRPAGAAVEIPMIDPAVGADWPYVEAPRMIRATVDWHPRVNGYSGDAPEGYAQSAYLFSAFPSTASLAHAESLDVRYVIIHTSATPGPGSYAEADAESMIARLPSEAQAERYGDAWLVDLRGNAG